MDRKAYAYRGFMLDAARHFMPVQDVRRIIEAAAACGMNRMHWHLTDDQGWRLEIKKYPLLTQVGAVRGNTYFGDNISETENNCGYYTQQEIRDTVAFAREKGVEIVPEIEVPGHASAMLAAYPQFGCRRVLPRPTGEEINEAPYPYKVITYAGIFPNLICAGSESAVRFLKDILDEVVELFPGPEIHIGGDEAVKMHWRRCPDCQKRMEKEGLTDERALQRSLVLEIGEYLAQKGRKTIVWNESLEGGGLPPHFIVQHWLGNKEETAAFMAGGGKVIWSDVEYFYISRPFSSIDVYSLWNMPPAPDFARGHEENLLGLECPLWCERITNLSRAAYLLFPRLAAIAMKAQGLSDCPDWAGFQSALREKMKLLEPLGLTPAPEEVWQISPEAAEKEKETELRLRHAPRMERVFEINDGMLMQESLERLLRTIGMPRSFALRVMDFAWAWLDEFSGGTPEQAEDGADILARHLRTAVESRWNGPWHDLPEKIWIDTMKCFTRFVNEHFQSYGVYGFDRGFWTTRQADARLFRVGELEYELCQEGEKRFIALHIPSDCRLEGKLLNDSVDQARAFLAAYFPAWENAPVTCESWLLSPALAGLLPPDSRILRFQRAFDLTPGTDDEREAVLQWVYRLAPPQQKHVSVSDLPEDTALRRNMKRFLLSGGMINAAGGPLARRFEE